jgi:hypothetical protein
LQGTSQKFLQLFLRTCGFSVFSRYYDYLPAGLEGSVDVPSHPTRIRQMLQARLKQLAPDKPVLAASLALVNKRCGQPSCACHHGGPLHQAHHLSFKEAGKTRTVYVPKDLVAEVQTWVAEYQRLKRVLAEISQLTLALVRGHSQHQKRKRGRP